MANYTWDSKDVSITVGGVLLKGFPKDSKFKISRNEDAYEFENGTDKDDTTRSRINDLSGEIVVSLVATSTSNAVLSGYLSDDENDNSGTFPVAVNNTALGMNANGIDAWIKKQPEYDVKQGVPTLEYTIFVPKLMMTTRG